MYAAPSVQKLGRAAGAVRGVCLLVLKSVFVLASTLVALVCFTGRLLAQPAPAEAAPSAPELVPQATSPASPAPAAAPPVFVEAVPLAVPDAARTPPVASRPMTSSFGPPSQLEAPVPRSPAYDRPLSENVALGLSLGGTLGAWSMMIGGMRQGKGNVALLGLVGTLVAPSMGHWYR